MRAAGIPFEEEVVNLDDPGFKQRVLTVAGTGKVPALDDSGIHVWESLAILEHLAERFPQAQLWPADPTARAHARAIAAEMHAGFVALRRQCPMNMWRPPKAIDLSPETLADIRRIEAIWTDCRTRYGRAGGGPFLFGAFGAADAMYAPIVSRLRTYAVDLGEVARAYAEAVQALPAWREWRDAALRETWVLQRNEVDWPQVNREPV